ncbi:hypothetical protein DKX38_021844 [Salix brachista]|uniref:Uncharacterized protein n=1 Tax=Salix brachista TaxID=2182728 RepID=A0A5N5K3U4_9ROSI|nr:hypothetical protein DKX38_021844 [Salix brachista]
MLKRRVPAKRSKGCSCYGYPMGFQLLSVLSFTIGAEGSDFEVDFGSEENASIIYAALAVDKELQPDKVKRLMSVSDGKLSVHFEAVEARFLRASFSSFVDILTLSTKTIEEFGKGMAS